MSIFRRIFNFYYTGFREMTVGRTLWAIILIKVFILFAVLKLFFFKDNLSEYKTPEAKSERVIENLINP